MAKKRPMHEPPKPVSPASWVVGVVVVLGLAATFAFFLKEDAADPAGGTTTSTSGRPAPAAVDVPAIDVPDPDTSEMLDLARDTIGFARQAVLRAPTSHEAWGAFGEACDAHKLYDPASVAYGQAHALNPNDFRWAYLAAVVEDFRGNDPGAIVRLFERALAINGEYPPLSLRYGDALVRLGELDRARRAYDRAIELDPDFAMAHRGLGQVLVALDEPAAARTALETAARIEPEDGVVYASLAQVYTRLEETALAEDARAKARDLPRVLGVPDPLRFAVERKAGTPAMARKRAVDAIGAANFAGALYDVRFLVEVEPDNAEYRVWLARCLVETGDGASAGEHFARALELEPEHPQALPLYAGWLDAAGRFAESAELWKRTLDLEGDEEVEAARIGRLALVQAKAGQLDAALASFERAAELGDDDAELFHNWGTAWMARDAQKAVACFTRALELHEENAGTHYNLGLSLEALGRTEDAEKAFARSAELDPAGPAAQRARGG